MDRATALDGVDQVVDDAALQAHDNVEIAQADVGIHDHDALTGHGQSNTQVCSGCGLAHAAFAGGQGEDNAHSRES